MDPRFAEVATALSGYFDGLYYSDATRLARVFHPRAHYVCASEGTLTHLTMDEYLPMVACRPSPASRGERRADRIVSIEFAGPVTAMVRAECSIGPKLFTDLLSFVRLNGDWLIVSKVFHFDIRDPKPLPGVENWPAGEGR